MRRANWVRGLAAWLILNGSWTELGDKLPTGTVAAVLAELVVKRVRAARDEHRDGARHAQAGLKELLSGHWWIDRPGDETKHPNMGFRDGAQAAFFLAAAFIVI